MLKALLCSLCWLPFAASAVTVEVVWEWPVDRVNGEPLPLNQIEGIWIHDGPCNATATGLLGYDGSRRFEPPATVGRFERSIMGPACLQAYISDGSGVHSASVFVPFTVSDTPPAINPPLSPTIVRIVLVFPTEPPPPPPPVNYTAYSPGNPNYKLSSVRHLVDGVLKDAIGNNTVSVGVPCDCSLQLTDANSVLWCSVGGQLQKAFNSSRPTAVQNGQPFPYDYVAACQVAP